MASYTSPAPQGVAQVVATLGRAVVRQTRTEDTDVLAVATALSTMPDCLAEGDLSRWEDDYWAAATQVRPRRQPMNLLEALFSFGSRNLYTAFDAAGTARAYASLAATLRAAGIHTPTNVDVSDW